VLQTLRKLLAWNRKEGSLYLIDVDAQGLMPEEVAHACGNAECAEVLAADMAKFQASSKAGESLPQLVRGVGCACLHGWPMLPPNFCLLLSLTIAWLQRDRLLRNRAMRRYRSKHPKQAGAAAATGKTKAAKPAKRRKKRTKSEVKVEPGSDGDDSDDWS